MAKQNKALTSNDKLQASTWRSISLKPRPLDFRPPQQGPAPYSNKANKKQVILHSLATMPGRLPTTKDFPSTVKLSIVPRKYVSHRSATPSPSLHLDPETLPSLSDTCGEKGYLAQTSKPPGLDTSLTSPRVDPR